MQVAEVAWEEAWGSILNLHIANNFSLFLHLLCTRFASSLFNHVYITKNVPKTCYRRKMLLVEQTGGKFTYLFKSQRQQATPQDVQCCLWSSSVCTLCFITTFDCLNGWKDLHALRYVLSYSQRNRCLANKILGKIICFDRGKLELIHVVSPGDINQ